MVMRLSVFDPSRNKDLGRKQKVASPSKTKTASKPILPCCFDEDLIPWGLRKGQCADPKANVCYNNNIVLEDSFDPKKLPHCCFDGVNFKNIDIDVGQCIEAESGASSCYVEPSVYNLAEKAYFDIKYKKEIEALTQKASEADKEAKEAIEHQIAVGRDFYKKHIDYRHDVEIKELTIKVLNRTISPIEKADEEATKIIRKISKPVEIAGENNFENEVLLSDKPVLVDFWRPGCPHCEKLSPIIDELVFKYGKYGKVKICKVNTSEVEDGILLNKSLLDKYKIEGVPTLILFKNDKNGKMVRRKIDRSEEGNDLEKIISEAFDEAKDASFTWKPV
ncbi:MAG: thioredoxin family protein [Endomicrobium sp.]|nr:thioredoxin family protein [Endomicrobium sp.]